MVMGHLDNNKLIVGNNISIVTNGRTDPVSNTVCLLWLVPEKTAKPLVKVISCNASSGRVETGIYKKFSEVMKEQPKGIDRMEEETWILAMNHGNSYTSNGDWRLILVKVYDAEPDFILNVEYASHHDNSYKWILPTHVHDCQPETSVNLNVVAIGFPNLDVKYRDKRDQEWKSVKYADKVTQMKTTMLKLQTRNILFDTGEYLSSSDEELSELMSRYNLNPKTDI